MNGKSILRATYKFRILCCMLPFCIVATANAQRGPSLKVNDGLTGVRALLVQVDHLCDSQACRQEVVTAQRQVQAGRRLEAAGEMVGSVKARWNEHLSSDLMQLSQYMRDEAYDAGAVKVSSPLSFSLGLKPHVEYVHASCADVLAAASALCSVYLAAPAAGEVLAAACELAAVAGYNKCQSSQG